MSAAFVSFFFTFYSFIQYMHFSTGVNICYVFGQQDLTNELLNVDCFHSCTFVAWCVSHVMFVNLLAIYL